MNQEVEKFWNRAMESAKRLIQFAATDRKRPLNRLVRGMLFTLPVSRALILYKEGSVNEPLEILERANSGNRSVIRIRDRVRSIADALDDRNVFRSKLIGPRINTPHRPFNGNVLMVVNSCGAFDQNGYSVRSSRLSESLYAQGMRTNFCARLGYPWDLPGRRDVPVRQCVESDEGMVVLRPDPDELVYQADPLYWRKYADYLKEVISGAAAKPSLIHAHSKYSNGIASAIAGRELGLPVVYELRGLWHLTRAQREPAFGQSEFFRYEELMEIWAADLADAVCVLSPSMKDWLVERGIAREKISVQPNGISPASSRNASPAEPAEESGSTKLAYIGALAPYEGVGDVISAVSILRQRGIEVSFDVFGTGTERDALEHQSRSQNLADSVRFHGYVPHGELQSRLGDFDIYPIVRTDSEVTRLVPPLKHLEPMLAGRVVLISRLRALKENVPFIVSEFAVGPGDPAAIADGIERLMNDRKLMNKIGVESRQWVMEERNWTDIAGKYGKIYKKAGSL